MSLQPFQIARTVILRFRYRLWTLLVVLAAISLSLGWWAAGAHRQRRAVARLEQLDATVAHRNEMGKRYPKLFNKLRTWIGRDFFDDVVVIQFRNPKIIRDADLQPLRDLPDVETLWLHETQLTDAGMAHLAHLARLKELVIYSTQVTDNGFRHLAKLRNLESLNMHGLPIGDVGFSHLAGLHNLKELSASYTHVTDAGLAHLERLSHLEDLDVSNCKITDTGLRHLHSLRELKELHLSGNEITSDGLRHVANLDKLEVIELASCPVDDRAVQYLARLPRLRQIHIGFTRMTYAGAKSLWDHKLHTGKHWMYIDGDSFQDLWNHPDFKRYTESGYESPGFGLRWEEIEIGPTLLNRPAD
jgi:hypothetical protein